jgi:RimJ/RimL family protein N-acetyltransferase
VRLRTERLILRRPEAEDLRNLLKLLSDPSFAATVPEIPRTEEEIREYLEVERAVNRPERDKCFNLLLERRQDNCVIGLSTLVLRGHSQGEIGYALHRDHHRLGYASEAARAFMDYAFNELGLHRIYAETQADNTASWKVMERLGMRREAYFREMVQEDGNWLDVVVYAVLADEWASVERRNREVVT